MTDCPNSPRECEKCGLADLKDAMSWFSGVLNDLRDNLLTKEEIQKRKEISSGCQMIKIIAIASAVACVAICLMTAFSHSPWAIALGAISTGATILVCYDLFRVADNMQQIVDDAKTEFFTSLTKKAFKNHLSKGTLLARYFIELIVDQNT